MIPPECLQMHCKHVKALKHFRANLIFTDYSYSRNRSGPNVFLADICGSAPSSLATLPRRHRFHALIGGLTGGEWSFDPVRPNGASADQPRNRGSLVSDFLRSRNSAELVRQLCKLQRDFIGALRGALLSRKRPVGNSWKPASRILPGTAIPRLMQFPYRFGNAP
jgi:hypothetical protein